MKKTKLTRSLLAACSIVALSAVMYGCVHSGDDSSESGMEMPMPDPEPMQTPGEQLAAANTALGTAQMAVGALTSSSTAEEASAAYAALGAAQAAVHAATNLPQNRIDALQAQVDTLTRLLETANTMAMQGRRVVDAVNAAQAEIDALTDESTDADVADAKALVTAARAALSGTTALDADDTARLEGQVASVESQIAAIQTEVAARPTQQEIDDAAADTKAAGTKAEAIGDEAEQETDAGLGGTGVTGVAATIAHDKVEIADAAMAGDDDPKFVDQMAGLDGGRTMLVRTMKADDDANVESEVVIVATDIKAPTATDFGKVHTFDVRADGEDATDDMPDDALNIAAGNLSHVMAGAFVAPAGTTGTTVLTFQRAVEDDDQTDEDETMAAAEIMGTFNGAMGTYKCADTASNCSVTVNVMGEVSAVSDDDDWVFIPVDGAQIDVPDANYLSYGFWLKKTTDADGATTYNEVETFAMATGIDETGDSNLVDVEGTATYEGGAVGVYVKNVLDDQANITSATSGHFKAAVELNASFGGGGVAANDQFTIDGDITGFVLQHGEENDWTVKLRPTDFSGRTAGNEPGKSAPGTGPYERVQRCGYR